MSTTADRLELPVDPPSRKPLREASLYCCGAVYGLWSDAGELIYVGQTQNLAARLAQHRTDRKKREAVAFSFVAIDSLDRRLEVETVEIVHRRPRLNQAIMIRLCKDGTLAEIRYKRKR